jgi:hypothetical protein
VTIRILIHKKTCGLSLISFNSFRPLFASSSEYKLKRLSSFYLSRSFRDILFSLAPSNIFPAFSFPSPGKRADRLSPFCFFRDFYWGKLLLFFLFPSDLTKIGFRRLPKSMTWIAFETLQR